MRYKLCHVLVIRTHLRVYHLSLLEWSACYFDPLAFSDLSEILEIVSRLFVSLDGLPLMSDAKSPNKISPREISPFDKSPAVEKS